MRIAQRVTTSNAGDPMATDRGGMRRMRVWRAGAALGAAMIAILAGCSSDEGALAPNQPPETEITSSVPANGEAVAHHVEVQFSGRDADGLVPGFEYLVHTYARSVSRYADIVVSQPTADDPRWSPTGNGETIFVVNLEVLADTLRADPQGDIGNGRFDRWHTVFVRAIDNEGDIDQTPDYRTFNAYTLAPSVWLLAPALASPSIVDIPRSFAMNWNGVDDIGDGRTQDPQAVRWVLVPLTSAEAASPALVRERLYDLPEAAWSDWVVWGPSDSTRQARLYDVIAPSAADSFYTFAIQGLDDAGAITPQFGDRAFVDNNFVILHVDAALPVGPRVPVRDTQSNLGSWVFDGDTAPLILVPAASADSVTLTWGPMDTVHYGGKSRDYRYGWNITNPGDDGQWSAWGTVRTAPAREIQAGGDRFFLQARDDLGFVTLARLEFQK